MTLDEIQVGDTFKFLTNDADLNGRPGAGHIFKVLRVEENTNDIYLDVNLGRHVLGRHVRGYMDSFAREIDNWGTWEGLIRSELEAGRIELIAGPSMKPKICAYCGNLVENHRINDKVIRSCTECFRVQE